MGCAFCTGPSTKQDLIVILNKLTLHMIMPNLNSRNQQVEAGYSTVQTLIVAISGGPMFVNDISF